MQQPPNQEYPQTDELDIIPLDEQRVIDDLVRFWQTRQDPRDLFIHIKGLSSGWGCGIGASFFQQVYDDLRIENRSKYAAASVSEFRQFLETEFLQLYRPYAERQAKAKAERQEQAKAAEA